MRRNGLVLLAMVVVVASAALSRAEFTVYDDFNTGSVPDSVLWMPISAYTASVSGGSLVVDANAVTAGGTVGARSKTTFGYGLFQFVVTSFTGGSVIFGINTYSTPGVNWAENSLYLRDDGGWALRKDSVDQTALPGGWQPTSLPVTYTFVYHADEVAIYRGVTLLFQQTDTNKIPQNALMRFEVVTYGSGTLGVDSVSYEPPPPKGTVIAIK